MFHTGDIVWNVLKLLFARRFRLLFLRHLCSLAQLPPFPGMGTRAQPNLFGHDRDQHLTPLAFVAAVMPYLNTSIQLRHNLAHYWYLNEVNVQVDSG
jgi:hypothetical protein